MADDSIKIEIKNIAQIRAAFQKAPKLMSSELNTAIKKSALNLQRAEVEQYKGLGIQVITGGLISSVERGLYFTNLRAEVGPNVTNSPGVDYAGFVELGTSKMDGRPFLHAAVENQEDTVNETFVQAVENVLEEIGKSI